MSEEMNVGVMNVGQTAAEAEVEENDNLLAAGVVIQNNMQGEGNNGKRGRLMVKEEENMTLDDDGEDKREERGHKRRKIGHGFYLDKDEQKVGGQVQDNEDGQVQQKEGSVVDEGESAGAQVWLLRIYQDHFS